MTYKGWCVVKHQTNKQKIARYAVYMTKVNCLEIPVPHESGVVVYM